MEIHAPELPVNSWRDIALHLGIVTIGILIALGLEGLVEWRHHQSLAREARENILDELRDNRGEVAGFLKTVNETETQIGAIVQATHGLMAHKIFHGNLNLQLHQSEVTETSWSTAQVIGAVSYMSYAEAKTYGSAYRLQTELAHEQTQSLRDLGGVLASMKESFGAERQSDAQLLAQEDRLNSLNTGLVIEQQIAAELLKRYDAALRRR